MKVRELIKILKREDQEEQIYVEIADTNMLTPTIKVCNEFYSPITEECRKTLPLELAKKNLFETIVILRVK